MKKLEEKKYWIWLSLIPNLGSRRKIELLKKYKRPEIIYQLDKKQIVKVNGIGEKIANDMLDINIRNSVQKHIEYMKKNNIDIVSINDKEYPSMLKEIYDFPVSLYIKGNKNILNTKSISIVGCRDVTQYGKSGAKYFSYNLAKQGLNIISGLAKGVDSYSHVGAICAQKYSYPLVDNYANCGKTIAVVASGLDIVYPKENEILEKQIIESGGAVISEYPLGVKPDKMNFPARNRIISGMSNGIIVVEAKEKSGTLITVDFALEQGRDVFVVPGNINSINSVGTNRLIQEGARLITNYNEIL